MAAPTDPLNLAHWRRTVAELYAAVRATTELDPVGAATMFRVARDRLFREQGAEIFGVSTDTITSHKKFQKKHGLTFPLLADTDHAVADRYGVWQLRKFMGRQYMGIARTTFVIDQQGKIKAVFPNVKVEGHADSVLNALKS